ncbi:MAG: AAC(3) family N-acetyltransferase [Lachnospiraceae bacterium]|nr:AAC(3) family N-acetyltransferase [Lachnospiraceae bacterium]
MARFHYNYQDIINAFQEIGLGKGDIVFIHSNIGFFGRMEGGESADNLCEKFYLALKETVGLEGTIVVPTFSYSFCHNEEYHVNSTVSGCGMFSEYMRKQPDVVRSMDPNFSVAATGALAQYFTENCAHESFGKGSFWERFLQKKGKLLCMNMDCGSTFVHYLENVNNVSYRYNKAFNGQMWDKDENCRRDYFVHYVYGLECPQDGPFFGRLDQKCRQRGLCITASLGKGTMLVMDAERYAKLITDTLQTEPRFLTIGGDGDGN